ncbi:MAG: hypothetical protein IT204_23325 [Fimbriimonadaceae bacterium]|nr:hypothetical protein [Fimbriimonadaceae bacterium]
MPWIGVLALVTLAGGETPAAAAFTPTSRYQERPLEGWSLLVNQDLLDEPELADAVLKEVGAQLYQVARWLPAEAVTRLRSVRIWVERETNRGAAVYHPSKEWLVDHGHNPDLARSVQLTNARNLLAWTRQQPWMICHELAHAWHHQVVGYDNAELRQAFEAAQAAGNYAQVLLYDGRRTRHYALNNVQEYWAEATEAYFGRNDFYPFVNAELREHDPALHALVGRLWGVK